MIAAGKSLSQHPFIDNFALNYIKGHYDARVIIYRYLKAESSISSIPFDHLHMPDLSEQKGYPISFNYKQARKIDSIWESSPNMIEPIASDAQILQGVVMLCRVA